MSQTEMHTIWLTRLFGVVALGVVASATAPDAGAQNPPTRLPAVVISARPDMPGPRKLAGSVRDTFAIPIEGVEVSIPQLQRRLFSRPDGSFTFESIGPGTYEVRARKIGYAPQIQTVVVSDSGGATVFGLLTMPRTLAPVVSSASRGGLSGTVGDTSYRPIAGATVRVLGHSHVTKTDSVGAFFIPLRAGSYVASVTQPGYEFRLVSVIIPPDSGRSVTVFLAPPSEPPTHERGANLYEFGKRLELRSHLRSRVYTRADLQQMGVEWALDGVRRGIGAVGPSAQMWVDPDCSVVVNGGPKLAELNTLTIDDIETIEIYPQGQTPRTTAGGGWGTSSRGPAIDQSPTRLLTWANRTKKCPIVYAWLR